MSDLEMTRKGSDLVRIAAEAELEVLPFLQQPLKGQRKRGSLAARRRRAQQHEHFSGMMATPSASRLRSTT